VTVTMSPPLSGTVRLETFNSFEDAALVEQEWDDLVTALGGSLYATFAWCHVWWRHYGAGRQLRLVAVRKDDELVGILPFFIDGLASPLGRTRVAKLIGSDSTVALVEPPVRAESAVQAFALVLRQLLEHDRLDMVYVGPCPGFGPHVDAARRAVPDVADIAELVSDRESGVHTIFAMPDGFDAYMRCLSKNSRHGYRRNVNKLNKTFRFEVDVVRDAAVLEPEFEAFVEMHQAQWNANHKLGHFGDWPGSREFSRDLVRVLARADRVRLIRLRADDQVVCYHWCLYVNGTYHWRLLGRLSGPQWDQFGLGRVSQLKMMELASAEGATVIEAGTGRYEYKEKLNAETLPLHSIVLCRKGLLPHLRARFTLAYGEFLNYAYYRIWYLRVAPRARIPRRPLWRSWIRRRF
jgi:CelD/BcsL family acetyltransferase involved in cellulose biosynthesis